MAVARLRRGIGVPAMRRSCYQSCVRARSDLAGFEAATRRSAMRICGRPSSVRYRLGRSDDADGSDDRRGRDRRIMRHDIVTDRVTRPATFVAGGLGRRHAGRAHQRRRVRRRLIAAGIEQRSQTEGHGERGSPSQPASAADGTRNRGLHEVIPSEDAATGIAGDSNARRHSWCAEQKLDLGP